jgi:hypothetical protein
MRQVARLVRVFAAVILVATFAPRAFAVDLPPGPDPDQGAKQGNDANVVVRQLSNGRFELLVQNTSGIGWINSFQWVPPAGMTVTKISHTSLGSCKLAAGAISCTAKLKPPNCTCRVGGSMTVDFTATGRDPTTLDGHPLTLGVVGSYLRIAKMTPVPYHIPSWLGGVTPKQGELPLCKKGQKSTKAHPCAKR